MDKSLEDKVSAHLGDKVDGPMTKALAGRTFSYKYTSGIGYRVSFDEEKVYFRATIPGLKVDSGMKYLSVPYQSKELRANQYLAHWMIKGREGHIALILDLERGMATCAGLMPGKTELFDIATFDEALENGEGALYNEV